MTAFYAGAALLSACALLFILPTLLRGERARRGPAARAVANLAVLRDQLRELDADLAAGTIDAAGYANSRSELERRVASDVPTAPAAAAAALGAPRRLSAGLLTLAVPALAAALYLQLGTPDALDPNRMTASAEQARQTELAELVEGMAAQMKKQPNDVAGWTMLARSYASMGNFEEAANSYRHLISLDRDNPDLLVDFADVLAMSRGKTMQGEPEQLVQQALRIDPENVKALSLSGSTLFERGEYDGAIRQWKKILPLVPPDSETARNTIDSIGIAQQREAELKAP
jgi:cytochrome c-type biogenesis protein CcmH